MGTADKNIAIGGQARSGTTLVSALIGASDEIAMFPNEIAPHSDYRYSNLPKNSTGLELLVRRLLGHTKAANRSTDFVAAIQSSHQELDHEDKIFFYLLDWWARQAGTLCWGFKSPELEYHGDLILQRRSDVCMIYMVRDPRDVAVSVVSRWWWQTSAVRVARKWARSAKLAARLEQEYKTRFRIVRYEDLVADPDSHLSSIQNWLGISYPGLKKSINLCSGPEPQDAVFGFKGHNSEFADIEVGQISKAPIGRYLLSLKLSDRILIRWIAGSSMRRFGYEFDSSSDQFVPKLIALMQVVWQTPIWVLYEQAVGVFCKFGLQYPANHFKRYCLRCLGSVFRRSRQ